MSDSIEQVISDSRAALGETARRPCLIKTVPKLGYCFVGEVTVGDGQRFERLGRWVLAAGLAMTTTAALLALLLFMPQPPEDLADHLAHGRQFAYTSGRALYIADADGSRPRLLARLGGEVFWPAWSSDGRRLRFTLQDPGQPAMLSGRSQRPERTHVRQ